jgi:hypothetical protein
MRIISDLYASLIGLFTGASVIQPNPQAHCAFVPVLGTCQINEVEMAFRDWLRMQESAFCLNL